MAVFGLVLFVFIRADSWTSRICISKSDMTECPQHHQSETADFCSVCGAEVAPAAVLPARAEKEA